MEPRRKHAVCNRLRINIGKRLFRQIVNQDVLESIPLPRQFTRLFRIILKCLVNRFGKEFRLCRHHLRQLFRRRNLLRECAREGIHNLQEFRNIRLDNNHLVATNFGNAHAIDKFAKLIEMKIEIVRKQDVVKRILVPVELFLVFAVAVQVAVIHVLRFDKRHRDVRCAALGDDVIRGTAVNAPWFVRHHILGQEFRQERSQRRTVTVLGRLARRKLFGDFGDVAFYGLELALI